MSIGYSSGFAIGYKLTEDEVRRIPEEIYDEYRDYDWLIELDCMLGGDYLLAIYNQPGAEPGTMRELTIPDVIDENNDDYMAVHGLLERYFPERAAESPKTYIYCRVY